MTLVSILNSRRLTQIALIAVFVLPLILAYALLQFQGKSSFHLTHHGHFFQTPLSVSELNLQLDSPSLPLHSKVWSLVFLKPLHCDQSCHTLRQQLNNVQLALGKNQDRVRIQEFPRDQMRLNLSHTTQFKHSPRIIVVDPNGICVMYYSVDHAQPQEILKDLKKLLRFTHA